MKKLLLCSGLLLLCYASNAQTKEKTDSLKVLQAQYKQLDSAVKAYDVGDPEYRAPYPREFTDLIEQRRLVAAEVYRLSTEIGDARRAELDKEMTERSGFTHVYRSKYHYHNVTKWHLGTDVYMLSDERKGGVITVEQRMWQGYGNRQDSTGILKIDGKTYNLYHGRLGVYQIKNSPCIVEIDPHMYSLTIYSDAKMKGTKTVYFIIDPDPITVELVREMKP